MSENEAIGQAHRMTLRPTSGGEASPERLWEELVTTADHRSGHATGRELAAHINENPFAMQSTTALGAMVARIVATDPEDPKLQRVMADLADLVLNLAPNLLSGMLIAEPDPRRRIDFQRVAVARLPLPAAFRLVAALGGLAGRPLSEPLRAQLRRMANRLNAVPADLRPEASESIRSTLDDLVVSLTTTSPRGVTGGFEPVTVRTQPRVSGRTTPEAERIVQMAIEMDAIGEPLWVAVGELASMGGALAVIDVIKSGPANATTNAIMKRIASPQELSRVLDKDPLDEQAADALLQGLGIAAARVLLEALAESRARTTRRYLLDRLATFGPEIQPLIEGRLKDNRWFVQRNMIALLRAAQCQPEFTLANRFLECQDPRVRREAVLWCLNSTATYERAIVAGLKDGSIDVLRPALQAARSGLPQAAVPVLAKRVLDSDFPPGSRVLALNLLGRSGSALALEALLHYAISGKTFLGKPKLAPKSPEMLAALTALARTWRTDRRASGILDQAQKSKDPEIVAATRTISVEMS